MTDDKVVLKSFSFKQSSSLQQLDVVIQEVVILLILSVCDIRC